MIIARTHHETYDYQGVQVVDICRWLREQYDCGGSQGYKSEFNEVSDMWNELYNAAVKVQNGRTIPHLQRQVVSQQLFLLYMRFTDSEKQCKNSEIIMEKSFPFEYNNIEKEGFFHD